MTVRLPGTNLILSLMVFVIVLVEPTPVRSEEAKIHISGLTGTNSFIFLIAKEKGFYRDNGIDALPIVASIPAGIQGLVGGSFDFSQILGQGSAVILRGAPLKIVMVFDIRPLFWLYAKKEITKVQDLKGKLLGVGGVGSARDLMLRNLLERHGLNPQHDVTIRLIAGPQTAVVPTFFAGNIDATLLTPVDRFAARKMGYREVAFFGDYFEYATGGVVVSEKTLREKTDYVRRFLRATASAFHWFKSERDAATKMISKLNNISAQEATEFYGAVLKAYTEDGTLAPDVQKRVIALMKEQLNIQKNVSPTDIYDFRILDSLNQTATGLGGR